MAHCPLAAKGISIMSDGTRYASSLHPFDSSDRGRLLLRVSPWLRDYTKPASRPPMIQESNSSSLKLLLAGRSRGRLCPKKHEMSMGFAAGASPDALKVLLLSEELSYTSPSTSVSAKSPSNSAKNVFKRRTLLRICARLGRAIGFILNMRFNRSAAPLEMPNADSK